MDEARERIATNIRKGVLEYCVLALLARREMYGLELADDLVERGLTASEGACIRCSPACSRADR